MAIPPVLRGLRRGLPSGCHPAAQAPGCSPSSPPTSFFPRFGDGSRAGLDSLLGPVLMRAGFQQ
eukprot:1601699-Rhodomonas_salina.1